MSKIPNSGVVIICMLASVKQVRADKLAGSARFYSEYLYHVSHIMYPHSIVSSHSRGTDLSSKKEQALVLNTASQM